MAVRVALPQPGLLARMLEESESIRRRMLEKPDTVLTRWPGPKAIGVASVRAMRLNVEALRILATWWVSACPVPKTVPIDVMRDEARSQLFFCLLAASRFNVENVRLRAPERTTPDSQYTQVARLRESLGLTDERTLVHLDGAGLKCLFSHGIRRFASGSTNRESCRAL